MSAEEIKKEQAVTMAPVLRAFLREVEKAFPSTSAVLLLTNDEERMPPDYISSDGQVRESAHFEGTENGFYIPQGHSRHPLPVIWLASWVADRKHERIDDNNVRFRVTDEGFKSRKYLSLSQLQVTLLHEFAHHLDLVRSKRDPDHDLLVDGVAIHGDSWVSCYREVIASAHSASLIDENQASECRKDCWERFSESIQEFGEDRYTTKLQSGWL